VRVVNGRGAFLADVKLDICIRADVVMLATGASYAPLVPVQMDTLDKHSTPNVLTLDKDTSKLGQNTVAHTRLCVGRAL